MFGPKCLGCARCCSVFSTLAFFLLIFFGWLIKKRSVTMRVTFHKMEWDVEEKANSVFMAAAIYLVTIIVSVISYKISKSKADALAPEADTEMR